MAEDDRARLAEDFSEPAQPGQKCACCGGPAERVLRLSRDRRLPICITIQQGREAVKKMLSESRNYLSRDIGADGAR